jgi:hypothetical protein
VAKTTAGVGKRVGSPHPTLNRPNINQTINQSLNPVKIISFQKDAGATLDIGMIRESTRVKKVTPRDSVGVNPFCPRLERWGYAPIKPWRLLGAEAARLNQVEAGSKSAAEA